MSRAFQIHSSDNVATLLVPAAAGERVEVGGARSLAVIAVGSIEAGHKIAIEFIPQDGAVCKYGVRIGRATRAIEAGEWVHLHNLASDYDERSATLDVRSGAPTDTHSAYV